MNTEDFDGGTLSHSSEIRTASSMRLTNPLPVPDLSELEGVYAQGSFVASAPVVARLSIGPADGTAVAEWVWRLEPHPGERRWWFTVKRPHMIDNERNP